MLCLAILAGTLFVPASGAWAAARPLRCKPIVAHDTGERFRLCSGYVATPDGAARLDVDVTLPASGDGPFPLVTLLHSLDGSKTEFMSDTVKGEGINLGNNNLSFASRGYAVLTYTARGFETSDWRIDECADRSKESVDGDEVVYPVERYDHLACRSQFAHNKYELKDAQYLIGRMVDGTLTTDTATASSDIGVAGYSYGGGQTWNLTRKNVWRTPVGRRVRLAAAVPMGGWTDLVNGLLPNGRARDDTVSTTRLNQRMAQPVGVKNALLDDLYLSLLTGSGYNLAQYLEDWKDRINEGEPYDGGEPDIVRDAVTKMLSERSAYFLPKTTSYKTAIFAVQGFTDFVFPADQAVSMYNRLRAEDEDYPISLYMGDWGHATAQSKDEETAHIGELVAQWFDHYLKGRGPAPGGVQARAPGCDEGLGSLYRADTWADLQEPADAYVDLSGTDGVVTSPADYPNAAAIDPLNDLDGCRSVPLDGADSSSNLNLTWAAPDEGFTMLGMPEVTLTADPSGPNMYVAARLWDVDPEGGRQTLVTRGVYRLGSAEPQLLGFQLFGNAWTFAPGHEMKLEVTADDSPSLRRWGDDLVDEPGEISVGDVRISLPQAAAGTLIEE
ncbi:MAG: CocE/NonD family hydrolase [Actinomycetota bacterium]